MTLVTIRNDLRNMVGSPTLADVSDTELNGLINRAYKEISIKFPHHKARDFASFSTIVSQKDYTLDAAAGAIFKVWDSTNNVKLEKIGPRQEAEMTSHILEGKPTKYIRYDNFLRLFLVPDAIYTIEYFFQKIVTPLSGDADVPDVPDAWEEGIKQLARWYYWDFKLDIPKAEYAHNAYVKWVEDMPTEQELETVDIDSGISLPTLAADRRSLNRQRVDFDTSP